MNKQEQLADSPEKALSELWKQKQSDLIDTHIIPMYATLRAQSIKYFLKDGTVSGSFRQALEDIMNDVRKFCNPQPSAAIVEAMGVQQEEKATPVMIECPECETIQAAIVEHTIPFGTYIHRCKKCNYTIMESEWKEVKPFTAPAKAVEAMPEKDIEEGKNLATDYAIKMQSINGGSVTDYFNHFMAGFEAKQPVEAMDSLPAQKFVNIYEDDNGRFISDTYYESYAEAFEGRDPVNYLTTIEFIGELPDMENISKANRGLAASSSNEDYVPSNNNSINTACDAPFKDNKSIEQ
jgi:hypothetical protein